MSCSLAARPSLSQSPPSHSAPLHAARVAGGWSLDGFRRRRPNIEIGSTGRLFPRRARRAGRRKKAGPNLVEPDALS